MVCADPDSSPAMSVPSGEFRRWLSLAVGFVIMLCAGNQYAISAWNSQLGDDLGYRQSDVSLIGSLGNSGLYFAGHLGWFHDRCGTRLASLLAAALIGSGYGLLRLGLYVGCGQPFLMGFALAAAGQGSMLAVITVLASNQRCFERQYMGKVNGVLFGGFGVSGAIFAKICNYVGDVTDYFTLMAVAAPIVLVLCGCGLVSIPTERSVDEAQGVLSDESDSMFKTLRSESFWLLFVIVFIGNGTVLMLASNISYIAETLGDKSQVDGSILAFSVVNISGRLIFGYISDLLPTSKGKVSLLMVVVIILSISQFSVAYFSTASALPWVSGVVGLAEGAVVSTFPIVLRTSLGTENFGSNFGMLVVSNALGWLILFGPLFSAFYSGEVGDLSYTRAFGVSGCLCLALFPFALRLRCLETKRVRCGRRRSEFLA